jgi:hypothetical protein
MVRKNLKLLSSPGDQQEQPFAQVNVIVASGSSGSEWQELAPASVKC